MIEGTPTRRRKLYEALVSTGFNQSAAGRVMHVSRETVRQRLLEVGGFMGLLEWAVKTNLASKAEADALAALAALAPANRQGANHEPIRLAHGEANQHEIRHLRGKSGRPIFADQMSTVATMIPQSSTIRLEGTPREFMKRVALEVALKTGMPREDMSSLGALMVAYFQRKGDPAAVADLLIEKSEKPKPVSVPPNGKADGKKNKGGPA